MNTDIRSLEQRLIKLQHDKIDTPDLRKANLKDMLDIVAALYPPAEVCVTQSLWGVVHLTPPSADADPLVLRMMDNLPPQLTHAPLRDVVEDEVFDFASVRAVISVLVANECARQEVSYENAF